MHLFKPFIKYKDILSIRGKFFTYILLRALHDHIKHVSMYVCFVEYII